MMRAIICFLLHTICAYGQIIRSGNYDLGLKLAFDSTTKKLTGYYENYSGWDEKTKQPRFSCIFYMEGFVVNDTCHVLTYDPPYRLEDTIYGKIELINSHAIRIKLPRDHGGCWNVQHFSEEPILFDIEKSTNWTSIQYVIRDRAYFYSEKSDDKKQKNYVVKYDYVFVEKAEEEWSYCTFYGKRTTRGWIKTSDLNQ